MFRIRFRILAGESESVKTSSGFAWFLGKTDFKVIKKSIIVDIFQVKI